MGTSAEAMQVPLDEEDDEVEEDEAVNDENHPLKRHLDSPDAALGMMPTSKRPRLHPGLSPEWGVEPREPLTSLNPQRLPPGVLASHDSLGSMSPETPTGTPTSFRPLPVAPRHTDHKAHGTPSRKPKGSSPGRQRTKSPKGVNSGGSAICSPKSSKERKKSPGRTKSPKSPKISSSKTAQPPGKTDAVNKVPLLALSPVGKENVQVQQSTDDGELVDGSFDNLEPDDQAIDDSIDAVIAQACAEHEPDPFAFSSGSESESNGFSSPRRLTIMEPSTPKLFMGPAAIPGKDNTSTPLHLNMGPGNWTMDDSINEVLRKVSQSGAPAGPQQSQDYMSSGSPSPPTSEPSLLKALEEKSKVVVVAAVLPVVPAPVDVKKKPKKELKTKVKKKDKPKDKERSKLKEKNKSRDKGKEPAKEPKLPWKEFSTKDEDLFLHQRDFAATAEITPAKVKSKEVEGSGRKDKEKHKDKKKDKERSKKDKRDKAGKGKEEKQKLSALAPFGLADMPPLFSPSACLRIPMLPPLPPILQDKEAKGKDKDKKKDKKEKKKKKEKEREKEKEKAKEKEREKEEKKKEKEREKEKEKRDKEKTKERIRLEKVGGACWLLSRVRGQMTTGPI